MKKEISLLFPAFGSEFLRIENKIINDNENISKQFLNNAANLLHINFDKDSFFSEESLTDELTSQYKAYIFSCILVDILRDKVKFSNYTAGYSMGIYAMLYFCESVAFEEGLLLIKNAYEFITASAKECSYGMGSIIGFEYDDIKKTIDKNVEKVDVINQNNRLSFVISGKLEEVKKVLKIAKDEGAINTKLLPIQAPYHSKFLKDAAKRFSDYLKRVSIKDSKYQIISGNNQKIVSKKDEIINELTGNIYSAHNWFNTMKKLIDLGIKSFFECGPGRSLFKFAKFIEGDYSILTIKRLYDLANDS